MRSCICAPIFAPAGSAAMRRSRCSSTASMPIARASAGICARRDRPVGAKRAAAGEELRCTPPPASRCRRDCGSTRPTTARYFLVPGLDRADHDAQRRAAHLARDGARVGTRHARSVVRHARAYATRSSSRSSSPTSCVGLGGLTLCLLSAKFLFFVPIRGSLLLIVLISMIYLLVSLGSGC